MTPFGLHLRKLRDQRGLSQKEMAAGLGVTPAYLSALEHGRRGLPSYGLLQRIAGFLNIIWDEAELLQEKADLSNPRIVIDTRDLSAAATELANTLSLQIDNLNEQQIKQLIVQISGQNTNDP